MNISEETVVITNRISKIISSMKIDNIKVDNIKSDDINKDYVKKLLRAKLDLSDFILKLDELSSDNNKIMCQTNSQDLLTILNNNKNLIDSSKNEFENLFKKIDNLLDQIKLNKKFSDILG